VDGVARKPSYKVKTGDHITGRLPEPEPTTVLPEPIPLDIVYEDDDLIVLNKPAGLVVHPAAGHPDGTLVNALVCHCPDLEGIGGEKRPGIVHRLDKDTSGIMVVTKSTRAHLHLSEQFKQRHIDKTYLALVLGSPEKQAGIIDLPIGRHPTDRKKMSTVSRHARKALTHWRVKERFNGCTLLEIDLKTGRTHQIRVHCKAMGHPIVGDPVYGGRYLRKVSICSNQGEVKLLAAAGRQMLHARRLQFDHPASGRPLCFTAPMPKEMEALIDALRGKIEA
jgi:23S rRNA pseudouridine1911/1915/1917 synthase